MITHTFSFISKSEILSKFLKKKKGGGGQIQSVTATLISYTDKTVLHGLAKKVIYVKF
jgi:hypothetical protein